MWIRSAVVAAGVVCVAMASNIASAQLKGPGGIHQPPPKAPTLPPIQPLQPLQPPQSFKPPDIRGPSGSFPPPPGGPPGPVGGQPLGCPANCPNEPDDIDRALRAGAAWVTLEQQKQQFEQLNTVANQRERVTAVLTILAAHVLVPVPYAASAVQRETTIRQTRKELETLLQNTLTTVVGLMVNDVRRLEPYRWNPFAGARRAEVERMTREVQDAGNRARSELTSPTRLREVQSPRTQRAAVEFRSGNAMSQLRQINQTKLWRNQ